MRKIWYSRIVRKTDKILRKILPGYGQWMLLGARCDKEILEALIRRKNLIESAMARFPQ
jgi:hypothetical protein